MAISAVQAPREQTASRTGIGLAPETRRTTGQRNVAIDVLRGFCIVMMVTSHVATASYTNLAVHFLRFVSGAEGFVFLSGLVLGMVYRRRMDAGPAMDAYRAIWRRCRTVWKVHVGSVLLAVGLNTALFRYPDIPTLQGISLGELVWHTAILQLQPGHMLNILPMYVFLLGLAPGALELMRRRQTGWLLLVSVVTFINTQYYPGAGRWADERSGSDAFPVLAWQILFIPGMVIGYHRAALRECAALRNRRRLGWSLAAALLAVVVIVSVQTPRFQFYNHEAWDLFLWERHPLRFGRVLYFLLSVSGAYLIVQAWLRTPRLPQFPMRVLETLGRNSLYAFLVHLFLALFVGALSIPSSSVVLPELLAIASLALVYAMSHYQVGRKWIPN